MTTPACSWRSALRAVTKRLQSRLVHSSSEAGVGELVACEYRVLYSPLFAVSLRHVSQTTEPSLLRLSSRTALSLSLAGKVSTKTLSSNFETRSKHGVRVSWSRAGSAMAHWAPGGAWQLIVSFGRERAGGFIGKPLNGQASFYDEIVSGWEYSDRTIQGAWQ